ncbi:hypothetical protein [Streptomyces botrytidirepellens]|uniref:hypothetical protein n=1 Tax=Streptomyces botrytidirepellens TaxID=2486417 RepID=UPI0011CDC5E2|nr:hypothetical protein [Streptomyces botrytidirepellens]
MGGVDRPDVPAPFAKAVQGDMARRVRAAVDRVSPPGHTSPLPQPMPTRACPPRPSPIAYETARREVSVLSGAV